jgi:hypothetical protein
MAIKIKKPAKINFYKFVKPEVAASDKKGAGNAALIKSISKNVSALNNIGTTLNSVAKAMQEFVESQQNILKNVTTSVEPSFVPRYTKPMGQDDDGDGLVDNDIAEVKMPGFLEAIFNLLKDFIILAIAKPALEWLSDPENREAVKRTVNVMVDLFKAVSGFLTDRVTGLIDNLYELFRDDKSWWEKIGDFFGAVVNFAGLFVAIRYLKNPLKLIGDFKSVLKGLFTGLKGAKKSLKGTLRRLGKAGLLVGAGLLLYNAIAGNDGEDGEDGSDGANGNDGSTGDIADALGDFARGGPLAKYAQGGWISGPQSGYPVSLDGGRSASFIGHGTEYVAQRAAGGFVIPFNTPATKSNPGLTQSRIGEAQGMGFDLGGMLQGFAAGGPTNQTSTERTTNKGTNRKDKNGGQKAVIGVGKAILKKGFTVAEHPNFTKNNYSGSGANTGKGFNAKGNSRVGGHSSGSAHYKDLALDVTDWRAGDWGGRTKKLAQKVFDLRKQFKLTQIIHDPWGSWFAGEGRKGAAIGGHPSHLHLAFADSMIKGGGGRQPSNTGSGAAAADLKTVQSMGFNKQQWDIFRHTVAKIESNGQPNNGYGAKGGSNDHYDGRYQLGADAKTDGARYAGLSDPGHGASAREKFRNDPKLQEKLFAGFTKANHTYLMGNAEYKSASPERKLQILGYAHNQGMGGAEKWMTTGVVGADGFGTKGTKYTDEIAKAFKSKGKDGGGNNIQFDDMNIASLDGDSIGDGNNENDSSNSSSSSSSSGFQFSSDPTVAFSQLAEQMASAFGGSGDGISGIDTSSITADLKKTFAPLASSSTSDLKEGTSNVETAKNNKKTAQAQVVAEMQKLAAVQNQQTQAVAQENLKQVASAQQAAASKKPKLVSAGGNTNSNLVSSLNSSNNPLKVFS